VLGRKNPSLKLDHLSKAFFAYMGKQIQSQLQKSQLSLALFFSFGFFFFFFKNIFGTKNFYFECKFFRKKKK